ncbi:MAG: BrnT family toxin [bacterium]
MWKLAGRRLPASARQPTRSPARSSQTSRGTCWAPRRWVEQERDMAGPTSIYDFEWDPLKARMNHRKHGVGFEEAATVFLDSGALSVYDSEHSEVEDRWITMGFSSGGRLLVVCHTFEEIDRRRYRVRIISSRRTTRKERQFYAK